MRADRGTGTDDYIRADDREGSDRHARAELRARRYDCVRIDHERGRHLDTSGATIMSALATSLVPTDALLEKRQMPLKLRVSWTVRIS